MKRTFNILLTLAIISSVVGFAYYLSEWVTSLFNVGRPRGGYFGEYSTTNYIKFVVYWLTGFVGFYVFGRIVQTESYMRNALLIAFGYLLVIGSHGGLDFSGANSLKILLSAFNIGIFCFTYARFQRVYYPAQIPNQ